MGKFAASFHELEVWQLGIRIVKGVYRIAERLPQREEYGLSGQMKRAAISLPANIAEGFRRRHPKEFRQSLHIALGSAAELETYCVLCRELFTDLGVDASALSEDVVRFQKTTNTFLGRLKS